MELDTSIAAWDVEVRECGVDWLTVTTADNRVAEAIEDWLEPVIEDRQREGAAVRPWAANGYRGRATEGIEFGGRPDGWICRIHGPTAHARWQQLVRPDTRVTRLDVQVTATSVDPSMPLAELLYNALERANERRRPPLALAMTRFSGGGSMLNIGRRSSERYLRLYEKSLEERGVWESGTWRWEVEYKSVAAQNAVHALYSSVDPGRAALALVYNEWCRHGHVPPFLQASRFPYGVPPIE